MNQRKIDKIDAHMKKILMYSCYIDCFTRILNELIQNGDGNIQPYDIPNLSEILTKLVYRQRNIIVHMATDWEFANV